METKKLKIMEHITEFEVKHKDGSFDIVAVYDLPEGLAWKWIKNKYPDSEIEFIALIHPDPLTLDMG